MNKYQEYILKKISIIEDKDSPNKLNLLKLDYQKIIIEQNENYNLKKYSISFCNVNIEKIEYYINDLVFIADKRETEDNKLVQCIIPLDFDNKLKSIKIFFFNNIVDPIELEIEFIDANKEKYDEKMAIEYQKELTKKASIRINVSNNVINVLFAPVNIDYSYCELELYYVKDKDYQLMGKYKVEKDLFFFSIANLCYGKYVVKLSQYNKEDNNIFISDYIEFIFNR